MLIVINRFKNKPSQPTYDKDTSKEVMNYSDDKKTSQELNPGDIQIDMNTN